MSSISLESLASRINREHEAALRDASSAIERARTVGRLLLEAKERCERGKWEAWLGENCSEISLSTAQRYMNVARHPEIEAISVRDAILKLAPPAPHKPNKSARVTPRQVVDAEEKSSVEMAPKSVPIVDRLERERPTATASEEPENEVELQQDISEAPERPEIDEEEAAALERAEQDWRRRIERVLASNDQLAEMNRQLEQALLELRNAQQARDRYMNENAALLRQNKALQRKLDRLEKKAA